MKQIEYLTSMLYSQLGITQEILDGTANEATMLNYYTRTIEPIVSAIADEMKRKFLSKTARSQHQSIEFFRDPFSLVPVSQIAEITDKMTRNEVMTSNEIRQIIGMKPSNDPKADQLHNSNISESNAQVEQDGSKLHGLEHKLKTKESIKRKIETDSMEKDISVNKAAEKIRDAVRYTSLTNSNNYVKSYNEVKRYLEDLGYKETRCRNYFNDYRLGKVSHKSIQSVF
jgi:hypothetical protein